MPNAGSAGRRIASRGRARCCAIGRSPVEETDRPRRELPFREVTSFIGGGARRGGKEDCDENSNYNRGGGPF